MKLLGILNNQIIFLELENKEQILKCYDKFHLFSKFALVYKDEEYYVIFFTDDWKHSNMVIKLNIKNFSFIGAGSSGNPESCRNSRQNSYFDSRTCEIFFGYDRPKEQEKQKLLLKDIEKIANYIFNL